MVTKATRKVSQSDTDKADTYHSTQVSLAEVLATGSRFEASAYDAGARSARGMIENYRHGFSTLWGTERSLINWVSTPFRMKRIYVSPQNGTPLFSSSDIINIDNVPSAHISRALTSNIDGIAIKKFDVMLSRSGTIGNVGFAGKHFDGGCLTEHALRLRCSNNYTAGFVAAFLRSKFGKLQITKSTYGSVIQHIEPVHLRSVIVPKFTPVVIKDIGTKFVEALNTRDRALDCLNEARIKLVRKIDVKEIEDQGHKHIAISLSKLRNRFEASFHNRDALELEKQLSCSPTEFDRLDADRYQLSVNGVTKFRKRVYVKNSGIPLLSSKQIFQIDPIDVKQLGKGIHRKDMPEIGLTHREVCVTRSGTIGNVFIVPEYMAGWAASEHILKIVGQRPEIQSLIYTWLSSNFGNKLVKRLAFGSVIQEIDRWQLAELPIPNVPNGLVNEIHHLVDSADKARTKAWHLEREAIFEIEDRIESNH